MKEGGNFVLPPGRWCGWCDWELLATSSRGTGHCLLRLYLSLPDSRLSLFLRQSLCNSALYKLSQRKLRHRKPWLSLRREQSDDVFAASQDSWKPIATASLPSSTYIFLMQARTLKAFHLHQSIFSGTMVYAWPVLTGLGGQRDSCYRGLSQDDDFSRFWNKYRESCRDGRLLPSSRSQIAGGPIGQWALQHHLLRVDGELFLG